MRKIEAKYFFEKITSRIPNLQGPAEARPVLADAAARR
jgi:hypothetical protein